MKLTKSTSRMRQPLNVFCRKHGTVEPTVSFYKGNQEIFGSIPALDCLSRKGGNKDEM